VGEPLKSQAVALDYPAGEHVELTTDAKGQVRVQNPPGGASGLLTFPAAEALRAELEQRWSKARNKPRLRANRAVTVVSVTEQLSEELAVSPGVRTVSLQPRVELARFVGLFFETSKSFLLPSAKAHFGQLQALYDAHPTSTLLVVGHADRAGSTDYNDKLVARARRSHRQNAAAATRPFRYQETFNAAVAVALDLDATDRLDGVTNRVATKAFTPAPTALTFPVATRRAPQARFDDQRPWGRVAGATSASTLIVEFQPSIVNGAQEVMRTGDADLSVTGLQLDGAALRVGRDPQGSSFVAPPAAQQPLKVPTIRVCGTTPAAADINALIDALVTEFFNANSTRAHVAQLPVARWQETVRRIVRHESGNPPLQHFETRGAGRRAFGVAVFGHEQHMPLFGAPAGFGLGQLDNPPVTRNQMFSYLEGLRASIDLIMNAKARAVHGLVAPHVGAFPAATIAAVFQRAVVRAYNGNSEFRFNAGAFEIFPTGTDAARLEYPNIVLGTAVAYRGFRTAVPFTSADFGP